MVKWEHTKEENIVKELIDHCPFHANELALYPLHIVKRLSPSPQC